MRSRHDGVRGHLVKIGDTSICARETILSKAVLNVLAKSWTMVWLLKSTEKKQGWMMHHETGQDKVRLAELAYPDPCRAGPVERCLHYALVSILLTKSRIMSTASTGSTGWAQPTRLR